MLFKYNVLTDMKWDIDMIPVEFVSITLLDGRGLGIAEPYTRNIYYCPWYQGS